MYDTILPFINVCSQSMSKCVWPLSLWSRYSRTTRMTWTKDRIREPKASEPVWYLDRNRNQRTVSIKQTWFVFNSVQHSVSSVRFLTNIINVHQPIVLITHCWYWRTKWRSTFTRPQQDFQRESATPRSGQDEADFNHLNLNSEYTWVSLQIFWLKPQTRPTSESGPLLVEG